MSHSSLDTSDDPRALRSRRRLSEALIRMLRREDLASIGVAELCREAGVHRTTFYGHFDSVGDLAAEVFASIIDDASAVTPPHGRPIEDVSGAYLDATVAIIEAVARDRRAIRTLLESDVSHAFRAHMRDQFIRRADTAIGVMRDNGIVVPDNTDVSAAYIAGGMVSTIELWASSDSDDTQAYARSMFENMPAWWPLPG
ncbi:MAG: TetR/AcrR family transcriptional regulator [Microbacterium gubbeenense]